MNASIWPPSRLNGCVTVPGDKSIAHRAIVCGALAHGRTELVGIAPSNDVAATIGALTRFGVSMQRAGNTLTIVGKGRESWRAARETIDCANSATTMRLLMGALAGLDGTVHLDGDASLRRRPMRRVADPLRMMGARVGLSAEQFAPLDITGSSRLKPITYALPVPSAQVKAALLFAAIGAHGRTELRGFLRSRDHSERLLPLFGGALRIEPDVIVVDGPQSLDAASFQVPGDPSSAAFWIAAAMLTPESSIELPEVCLNPTRAGLIDVLLRMGARIETVPYRRHPEPTGTIRARTATLRGITVEKSQIPFLLDELPLLAVVATQAEGSTVVRGARELRVKESDRIEAIAEALGAMGAVVATFEDGFRIEGPQRLRGATVSTRGDHRIAMSMAVAALIADGVTVIEDADCVDVSYPGFFATLRTLGVQVA